ncbi:MAG: flagellar biosynthetic protein FliR [Betaproteobacteria bacterium]|nr:flagellar biosynthetic protein FliR [Betaproteobacteria bacterium]
MIVLTQAQLEAWIAAFIFPLARMLSLFMIAPPFSNAGLSVQVRLIAGLAVTLSIAPALPPMPAVAPASWEGLLILAQQMLIGFAMGFVMRTVFAAVTFAGDSIGVQVGLGFATFYDPQTAGQTPVLSEFLTLIATLFFLAINGHLMMIAGLVHSFETLPVGMMPGPGSWANVANNGAIIFSYGVLLVLPLLASMLIINTALGVLTRAAPQLNLFAVGFPITLSGGLLILMLSFSNLSTPLQRIFEFGLQSMTGFFTQPGQ